MKNKAYYKRYQVKYRRRRDGKTDYRARRGLIIQDKSKYNTPKYRMIVRITNSDVVCQIACSKLEGDHILAAAYSHELPAYGYKTAPAVAGSKNPRRKKAFAPGLTNYAAAYATGLLVARRALAKLGLADLYKGAEASGEDYNVSKTPEAEKENEKKDEGEGGRRPFRVVLDVGLARTTTGARIFGAMKGACDGGLDIPHKTTRFPGTGSDKSYDPEVHRKYIFGGHVSEYMNHLQEEDPGRFAKQFSAFKAAGMSADNLEAMYKTVHANIRKNPVPKAKTKSAPATKRLKRAKLSAPQKHANANQKLQNMVRKAQQA